jgi:hypothetical protein
MAVTAVTKSPNLVTSHPEGMSSRLRFICAWGGAPHPQWRRDLGDIPSRSPQKLHSPPSATEADAHTFASLRSLQPLACFHLFFRELPLLTRSRPAQPLLLTTESARNSLFLSPIDDTIAAARPCMFIECASAKNPCPACARFDACTC